MDRILRENTMPFALRFAEPYTSQEEIERTVHRQGRIVMSTVQTTVYATGTKGADSCPDED